MRGGVRGQGRNQSAGVADGTIDENIAIGRSGVLPGMRAAGCLQSGWQPAKDQPIIKIIPKN